MSSRIVALPMYREQPAALEAFWQGLRHHLEREELAGVPDVLTAPSDLGEHWLDPSVLLSQACGYPLVDHLAGRVRLVGTPRYAAAGCDGAFYRSRIVVRAEDPAGSIADLQGRRAAFNASDSQSGYNCLRAMVAPLARGGRFFEAAIETGSQRCSLAALQQGEADVAAVDCVSFALLADAEPRSVAGLRTLCWTKPTPGLPLVTALDTSDDDLFRLRRAFAAACRDSALAACRAALRLDGLEILPFGAYDVCRNMAAEAIERGYPVLA
jgi:ABC-type phosphate/phosphonate transport system substrate-binding protein